MRVYELIEKLQECNPFAVVMYRTASFSDWDGELIDTEEEIVSEVYQKDVETVEIL
jgi:hypothetical protein